MRDGGVLFFGLNYLAPTQRQQRESEEQRWCRCRNDSLCKKGLRLAIRFAVTSVVCEDKKREEIRASGIMVMNGMTLSEESNTMQSRILLLTRTFGVWGRDVSVLNWPAARDAIHQGAKGRQELKVNQRVETRMDSSGGGKETR